MCRMKIKYTVELPTKLTINFVYQTSGSTTQKTQITANYYNARSEDETWDRVNNTAAMEKPKVF